MTISRKFTLWITGVVVTVGLVSALVYYRIAMRHELGLYASFGRKMGLIIEQSIGTSMMARQRQDVQRIFENLRQGEEISGAFLIDTERVVRAGTDTQLVGRKFSPADLQCHGCHERGQGELVNRKGDTLRYVQHLSNRRECSGCHDTGLKYNGALVIDFSMKDVARQVRREMTVGYLIFLPAIGLIGLGIIVLSRRLIHQRITAMTNGVRQMKNGSYGTRLPVENDDEITDLSRAFNEMSQAISERDHERELLLRQVSRSFETWQSTFDSISDLIAINDSEGRILKANAAFLSYFGLTASQAFGAESAPLFYGGERVPDDSPFLVTLREKRTASQDVYNQQMGRTFQISTYPYSYAEAEFEGFVLVARDITQRVQAQKALSSALELARTEQAKTDSILAAIGDGVVIMDRQFRVIYQNEMLTRMVGNHLGEVCYMAFEGKDAVCDGCPVARSFEDGGVHTSERLGNVAGRSFYVETTSSPLRDAEGSIVAGIEVVRDISDRKKQEEAIRRNFDMQTAITRILEIGLETAQLEDVLARILDLILSVPWLSIEAQGSIFVTDPGGERLTMMASRGLSACVMKECRSLQFGACLCGRAALHQEIQHAGRVDERHDICGHGIEPHGHYCVPMVYSGATIGVINLYLKEGHPRDDAEERFLAAIANAVAGIIRRKRIEQERENLMKELDDALYKVIRAQKEWVSTFDSITDMIAIIDRDYRITRVNRAFAQHYGMIPQEVLGRTCHELVHQLGSPVDNCPHAETMARHATASAEVVDQKRQRIYKVTTFPYYSPQGEMIGTIHVSRDITEERDRELRLIMSERLASLGQMASGIAHEINNPLAAIGGCAEGLMNRVSQGRIDAELFGNYLGIIREEVMRCKSITEGMLSIVRKSSYELRPLNLNDLLRKTVELVNFQGRLKNIDVEEDYDARMPVFLGNEGELKQAFLAIISNALDAMEERGTLTIGTEVLGGRLVVRITDTGCGIPAQQQHRIFDPFFTLKGDRGGTGLGLSITNKIITNHKGEIHVFSEEGRGTTFVITFQQAEA